jgi:hypothetical protein
MAAAVVVVAKAVQEAQALVALVAVVQVVSTLQRARLDQLILVAVVVVEAKARHIPILATAAVV